MDSMGVSKDGGFCVYGIEGWAWTGVVIVIVDHTNLIWCFFLKLTIGIQSMVVFAGLELVSQRPDFRLVGYHNDLTGDPFGYLSR